ncbi:septum formation inhibitor Maf [Beggiatoa alba]|nr:septum formation inhibitor Maf [Beggiatoa alba]
MSSLPVYLASNSPRRCELLDQMGVRFEVLNISIPENSRLNESPEDYVRRLASEKAQAGMKILQKKHQKFSNIDVSNWQSTKKNATIGLVIGADTAVVCDGDILGKPATAEHAEAMLRQLSAKTHEVFTAVTVSGSRILSAVSRTLVTFRELSEQDVKRYIATKEGLDKAGSYAIQGKAAIFIENLQGSYSAVMGLPLYETAGLLVRSGNEILPELNPSQAKNKE